MDRDQSSLKLASLLDTIDRNIEGKGGDGEKYAEVRKEETAGTRCRVCAEWVKYTDVTSGRPYYYNITSKITQWEMPAGCEVAPELSKDGGENRPTSVCSALPTAASDVDNVPYGWMEHFDPVSKLPYYHNVILKITQWGKPKCFDASDRPVLTEGAEYTEKAYFSKESGRFSGTSSYWQKVL